MLDRDRRELLRCFSHYKIILEDGESYYRLGEFGVLELAKRTFGWRRSRFEKLTVVGYRTLDSSSHNRVLIG